jgi:hypothetical protein
VERSEKGFNTPKLLSPQSGPFAEIAIDAVDCRKDFLDAVLEKFVRQDLELRSQTTPNH